MADQIYIMRWLPENQRKAAARMYFDAFQGKIGWLLGGNEKGPEFIKKTIRPEFAICAMKDKGKHARLARLTGFKTNGGSMVNGTFSDMVKNYGFFSSLWHVPFLSLLERDIETGTLLMDGIVVSPDLRGKGTGTKLLREMIDYVKEEKFDFLRLDVVPSNP